jgi:hypothetical protein
MEARQQAFAMANPNVSRLLEMAMEMARAHGL